MIKHIAFGPHQMIQLVTDPKAAVAAMDIVYNIADAINKIGFGLVIYSLSRSED